jgi:hypothetical protein
MARLTACSKIPTFAPIIQYRGMAPHLFRLPLYSDAIGGPPVETIRQRRIGNSTDCHLIRSPDQPTDLKPVYNEVGELTVAL